jgi:hypothetical protein
MSDQVEKAGFQSVSNLLKQGFGHESSEPVEEVSSEPVVKVEDESANSEAMETMTPNGEVEQSADAQVEEESSEELQASESEGDAKPNEEDTEKLDIEGKTLTVKYNDRDWIKKVATKAVNLQKGMNQAFKERDSLKAELETLRPDVEKYKAGFEKLDEMHTEASESGDWVGFIQNVIGNDVSVDTIIEEYIAKNEYLSGLTDDERSAYEANLKEKRRLRELEKKLAAYEADTESKKEEVQASEKSTLQKQVQTDVNAAFYEYRFGSEVGDEKKAHRLNRMAFREFNEAISGYETDQITEELIHKVMDQSFKNIRGDLNIGKSTKVKTKKAKQKAMAAKEMTKAVEQNQEAPDFRETVRTDMSAALRQALHGNK